MKCIEDEIPFAVPEGWVWCRLGTICSEIQYGLSNSAEASGSHRLLRITAIQDGCVDWDSVPFTTVEDDEKYILRTNDIVFARTGATVGKSFLISETPYKSVYASYLIRIRLLDYIDAKYIYSKLRPYLNKVVLADDCGYCTSEIVPLKFADVIYPKYAQLFLMSPFFVSYANHCSYGMKMPRLGTRDGQLALFAVPPYSEQLRIVNTVEQLKNNIETIEDALF